MEKDSPVITKTFTDDKKIIIPLDEIEYKKQERVLKKYFTKSYKYLIFDFFLNKAQTLPKGKHTINLRASKLFTKVYGKLELHLNVTDKAIILENITPTDIITECHKKELETYKGVPIRDKKDIQKIKIILAMED